MWCLISLQRSWGCTCLRRWDVLLLPMTPLEIMQAYFKRSQLVLGISLFVLIPSLRINEDSSNDSGRWQGLCRRKLQSRLNSNRQTRYKNHPANWRKHLLRHPSSRTTILRNRTFWSPVHKVWQLEQCCLRRTLTRGTVVHECCNSH